MGLPVILSALHLFNFLSNNHDNDRDRDHEKAEPPTPTDTVPDDDRRLSHDRDPESPSDELPSESPSEDDHNADPLTGARRLHRLGSATTTFFSSTIDSKNASDLFPPQHWWRRATAYVFPPEESEASLEKFVPHYRWTPIISGVLVPFSILLEIPGLTEHWYIRTENNKVIETRSNPAILDVGLAVSMACALAANICLILRFLERRVKTVTILTILFLTLHDVINIVVVTIFGAEHRFNDGFTYGQSFWMTVCSTIASTITNVSVIIDYVRTPDFARSGSGLTRKQRALVIIVIVLLVYIAFGALVNSLILNLNFIDGLYFTVVTIETIGFGDIHPINTGTRVFTCFYMAFGIINVGVAVAMTRETVLEGLDLGYRKRVRNMRIRRREARRFRRWEARWRRAVIWRLKARGKDVWVPDDRFPLEGVHFVGLSGPQRGEVHWLKKWMRSYGFGRKAHEEGDPEGMLHIHGHPHGKHININALTDQELEAAALEAGVPLQMFLSPARRLSAQRSRESATSSGGGEKSPGQLSARLRWFTHRQEETNGWPTAPQTPTHAQLGRMAAMVTKFSFAVTGAHVRMIGHAPEGQGQGQEVVHGNNEERGGAANGHGGTVDEPSRSGHDEPVHGHEGQIHTPGRTDDGGGLVTEAGGLHPRIPEWAMGAARMTKEDINLMENQLNEEMASEERKAYFSKLSVAWSLFILFWLVGSAIFHSTEGWPYGDAMYFCFMAFTTTGYGDFAPATPAGRSVFVFWALIGVATMTILIAVIEETGSSKYKHALHSKAFDSAVKKFRARETQKAEKIVARARPQVPRMHTDHSLQTATRAAQAAAQQALEQLPDKILKQARTFHSHLQYFSSSGNSKWEEATTAPQEGERPVGPQQQLHRTRLPRELRSLLDELAELEEIGERTKRDIIEDDDARNTLLMLSIERNLRELINAAERALGALAERDGLLELQRQHEQQQQRHRRPPQPRRAATSFSSLSPKSDWSIVEHAKHGTPTVDHSTPAIERHDAYDPDHDTDMYTPALAQNHLPLSM